MMIKRDQDQECSAYDLVAKPCNIDQDAEHSQHHKRILKVRLLIDQKAVEQPAIKLISPVFSAYSDLLRDP